MLLKSKRSAMIMSSIASLSYALAELTISLVYQYLAFGSIPAMSEELPSSYPRLAILILFLMILALSVVIGGFFINRLSPEHFGWQGAIRWVAAGVMYAILSFLYRAVADSIPVILKGLSELVLILAVYIVVFKAVPLGSKTIQGSTIEKADE